MTTYTIPNVIAQNPRGERIMDVYSHLLTERIVYLGTAIDAGVANALVAQLIFLESDNPDADIQFYINCEGGDPSAMLAIYDTMRYIRPRVCDNLRRTGHRRGCRPSRRGRRRKTCRSPARTSDPAPTGCSGARNDPRSHLAGRRGRTCPGGHRAHTVTAHGPDHRDPTRRHRSRSRVHRDRGLGVRAPRSDHRGAFTGSWMIPAGHATRPERTRRRRAGSASRRAALSGPQALGNGKGQIDQGDIQRAGDRSDHFARRLFDASFHLGEILRRDAGATRRLAQLLAPLVTKASETLTERVPPQRLASRRRTWGRSDRSPDAAAG